MQCVKQKKEEAEKRKKKEEAAAAEEESKGGEGKKKTAAEKQIKKGGYGLIHKKTHTRKSNKKNNKRKTKRIRGGEANKCIDVKAICDTVTSLITNEGARFISQTNKAIADIADFKKKITR